MPGRSSVKTYALIVQLWAYLKQVGYGKLAEEANHCRKLIGQRVAAWRAETKGID